MEEGTGSAAYRGTERGDRDVTMSRSARARPVVTRWAREPVACSILAAAAFAFLWWRASRFFPNDVGFLGHDYAWFLPTLVVGHFWSQQNGWLTPPFFTPAMCGGVPFLANPQSVFFSVPQLLLLVFEPAPAMLVTLLIAAAVGGAGCYFLLRRYFETSVAAATLGAILFLLNGFVFYRMVVGHLTYHAFAVAPVLACVVVSAQRTEWTSARQTLQRLLLPVVVGGLLVAYVTYGGALNFQIPIALTVACTLLILQIERGFRVAPWLVLTGAGLWGILLSAMKIVPAAMLVSEFPRSYIPRYLFQSPVDTVRTLVAAFFVPAALPDGVLFGTGAALGRHEFEFGLSIVPLLLGALALRRGLLGRVRFQRRLQWVVLAGILLIPIALTFGPGNWGDVLLRVPVINNNTSLVRWWALYLLPLVIITVRCFDIATSRRSALLACCVALAVGQESAHNPSYYFSQGSEPFGYDPAPATKAYREVTNGRGLPRIERVVRSPRAPSGQSSARPNDAFVEGGSAWPCYEPLFGYDNELIPDVHLVNGSVTLVSQDQRLNLVDASAYFARPKRSPESWRFDASRLVQASRFAAYRPYEWQEPWWHSASVKVTVATLVLSMTCLALWGVNVVAAVVRRRR